MIGHLEAHFWSQSHAAATEARLWKLIERKADKRPEVGPRRERLRVRTVPCAKCGKPVESEWNRLGKRCPGCKAADKASLQRAYLDKCKRARAIA